MSEEVVQTATPATPAPVATPPAPAAPSLLTPDADEAGAIEVIRAMMAARGEETAETPAEAAPAEVEAAPAAEPEAPVAKEAAPAGGDKLFERLTASESANREMSARLRELEAQAAKAAEFDRLVAAAEAGDASPLFQKIKWTPETVAKYAEGGKEAIQPTVIDNKVAKLEAELARFRAEAEAAQREASIRSYKDTLRNEFQSKAQDFPHFKAYFTDPENGVTDVQAAVDQVFQFQAREFQTKQRSLTFDEAAKALETGFGQLAKRFGAAPASVAPKNATSAPRPPAPTPTAKPAPVPDDGTDPDERAAIAVINSMRAASRK